MAFFKSFDLLKDFSEHILSSLTYQSEEVVCSRGQVVYSEGQDKIDNIYLVKRGEFQTFKRVFDDSGQPKTTDQILEK